jgi:hypothetical protein
MLLVDGALSLYRLLSRSYALLLEVLVGVRSRHLYYSYFILVLYY